MLVPQLFKPKYECHRSVRLARMIKMTDVLCCGVMMLESMRMILHQVNVKCIRCVISLRINRFVACACVIYVLILFFFITIKILLYVSLFLVIQLQDKVYNSVG